jgi:hypothetical protein
MTWAGDLSHIPAACWIALTHFQNGFSERALSMDAGCLTIADAVFGMVT